MPNSKPNVPTVIVILGATGDLVAKKIAPALFNLYLKGELPRLFLIKGFSRRDIPDQEFQQRIKQIILKHKKRKVSKRKLNSFIKLISYQKGEFTTARDYKSLAQSLGMIDKKWKTCANKLFYLSVPPKFYEEILVHLSNSGLTSPCSDKTGWSRVLVEKPFGKDLKTAIELDTLLGKLLKEEQIYRIDHYLAKEMVQNILTFRFSNNIFEKVWSNKFIESIQIRLWEKIGVEHRGPFYDGLGTLRDVGQNHLLLMLGLLTMDDPAGFTPEEIRSKRIEILKTLRKPSINEIKKFTFRAQHAGYRKIEGVAPRSQTETYFKLQTELDSPRWQGVPITLESGKSMGEARKDAVITFKHPVPCLCQPGQPHQKNKIIFILEPKEGIHIDFWTKKPGLGFEIEERDFNFFLRNLAEKIQYTEEYEKLLLDAINGDQTLFLSTKEVQEMWRFVDPIVRGWENNLVPLKTYKPDTHKFTSKISFQTLASTIKKQIGLVGLGKMGSNLVKNLREHGWQVETFNRSPHKLRTTDSIAKLVAKLEHPKLVWLMVPAGKPVDEMMFGKNGLVKSLKKGDVIIDGGNSWYKNTIARSKKLKKYGIGLLDAGVSGGPGGALEGACVMVGGDNKLFKKLEPLFDDISTDQGYQFFAGAGAGHFVKMVHNGIEYGMMQALAEGFAVMKKAKFNLDLSRVADVYNHGSVIESRLVEWLYQAFKVHGQNLKKVTGKVSHTGEGAWTVKTAKEFRLKARVIEDALKFRVQSQKNPSYTGKIVSALREQFGGHSVKF